MTNFHHNKLKIPRFVETIQINEIARFAPLSPKYFFFIFVNVFDFLDVFLSQFPSVLP